MKYENHWMIEVPHQGNVKINDCQSYSDMAMDGYGSFDYMEWESMNQVIEFFGEDDIPDFFKEAKFPCVEITWNGDFHDIVEKDKFDLEAEAFEYLAHDLNRLIVIDSSEDAIDIYNNYKGHMESSVKASALQIYNDNLDISIDVHYKTVVLNINGINVESWDHDTLVAMYGKDNGIFETSDECYDDFHKTVYNTIMKIEPLCFKEKAEDIANESEKMIYWVCGDNLVD